MNSDNREQQLVRVVGSTVLAITGGFFFLDDNGNDTGDLVTFACSGFAMSFGGFPVLVTAGHVIQDILDPIIIHNDYKGHRLRLAQVNLLDCFGEKPAVKTPTPFSIYSTLPRMGIDQALRRDGNGLDFGIILLPRLYWDGFFKNDGRILAEDMWATEGEHFDVYKMVGIPVEPQHSKMGHLRLGVFSFLEATDPDVKTTNGKPVWFIGTMPEGVSSVEGVSGGPIFGFRKVPGGWEYKIVAMQSWQLKGESGKVYGTPLRSFGPIVSQMVASLTTQGSDAEPSAAANCGQVGFCDV